MHCLFRNWYRPSEKRTVLTSEPGEYFIVIDALIHQPNNWTLHECAYNIQNIEFISFSSVCTLLFTTCFVTDSLRSFPWCNLSPIIDATWFDLIQFDSIWFENRWLALLDTLIRYILAHWIDAITDKLLLHYRIGSCFVIDSLSSCLLYRNVTAPFYRNKVQRPGRWGSNAWSLFRRDEDERKRWKKKRA